MALDPTVAANGIKTAYMKAAALNADMTPVPNGVADPSTFALDFATAYNEYAMAGEVPGALNVGGDFSTIVAAMSVPPGTPTDVSLLALAFATFWSTVCILPGLPMHGGIATVSVTNNAMALVADFESAILASTGNTIKNPPFLHLIENIESMAVKNIIWTVIETVMVGPAPTPLPFPESIS